MKISIISIDICLFEFYEYIRNTGKISMDILKKILIRRKLLKTHKNI